MSEASELRQSLWFVGVVGALVVLFAAGLRLRVPPPGPIPKSPPAVSVRMAFAVWKLSPVPNRNSSMRAVATS